MMSVRIIGLTLLILFIGLLTGGISTVYAQTDPPCAGGNIKNFSCDYCYESPDIKGRTACFSKTDEYFYLVKAKKQTRLPLPTQNLFPYLVSLSEDSRYKLSATDILFIQQGLQFYQQDFVMNALVQEATQKKWTASELTTFPYKKTPSGLGIHVLQKGMGELPAKGKKVKVHYRGYLNDGSVFDASLDRGTPFEFSLGVGQVIKGWDEGVATLPYGSRAILEIPSELGYGSRGVGPIPGNATLYFEVLVLE